MLELRDVRKRFGGLVAVNDMTFSIEDGECVALVGPNGAGKTTLFSIVAGFERADSGVIKLDGAVLRSTAPHELVRRGLARSFQIPRPFLEHSVLDNVLVACEVERAPCGRSRSDRQSYAQAILEQVGLGERSHVEASVLSVGELKRLELARVLATNPRIILLDEPFGGLTTGEIGTLVESLRDLRDRGRTMLIVEHRLREVFQLVSRVLVMDRGSLLADGTPGTVIKDRRVLDAYFGDKGVTSLGLA